MFSHEDGNDNRKDASGAVGAGLFVASVGPIYGLFVSVLCGFVRPGIFKYFFAMPPFLFSIVILFAKKINVNLLCVYLREASGELLFPPAVVFARNLRGVDKVLCDIFAAQNAFDFFCIIFIVVVSSIVSFFMPRLFYRKSLENISNLGARAAGMELVSIIFVVMLFFYCNPESSISRKLYGASSYYILSIGAYHSLPLILHFFVLCFASTYLLRRRGKTQRFGGVNG